VRKLAINRDLLVHVRQSMRVQSLTSLAPLLMLRPFGPPPQPTWPRRAILVASADDVEDDSGGGELLSPGDASVLRDRIARIQKGGLGTPKDKLFEIATEKPPSVVLRDFFTEAPPLVQQAMQDAVVSLLGALPPMQFDATITTTGDKLASLMLQLQMTGYMLRNAEYVTTLRTLLNIRSRTVEEYQSNFDRLASDSGYIESDGVEEMLREVYKGEPPAYEASTLMQLFDTNGDGRISWDEFVAALGGDLAEDATRAGGGIALPAAPEDPDDDESLPPVPRPAVTGTVTVTLEDGKTVEVEAAQYMEELQAEAKALRAELASLSDAEQEEMQAVPASLSAYIQSLPEARLKVLTEGISEDVVSAMQMVVKYILQVPDEDGNLRALADDDEVKMEQQKLQQLCLYQLVMGYRLREAEATGEAQQRLGL